MSSYTSSLKPSRAPSWHPGLFETLHVSMHSGQTSPLLLLFDDEFFLDRFFSSLPANFQTLNWELLPSQSELLKNITECALRRRPT